MFNLSNPYPSKHHDVVEDIPVDAQSLDGSMFMGLVCRRCGAQSYGEWKPRLGDIGDAWKALLDEVDLRPCWPVER